MMNNNDSKILLEVKGLKKYFPIQKNLFGKTLVNLRAVDNVSFQLEAGKTIGVVGESGCGKTTLGRTILQLYDTTGGKTLYYGHNLDDFMPQYYITGINKLPSYSSKFNSLKNQISKELLDVDSIASLDDITSKIKELEAELAGLKEVLALQKAQTKAEENKNVEATEKEENKAEEVAEKPVVDTKSTISKLSNNIKLLTNLYDVLEQSSCVTGGYILSDSTAAKNLLLLNIEKTSSVNKLQAIIKKEEEKLLKLESKTESKNYADDLEAAKKELEVLNQKEEKSSEDKKQISALVKKANLLESIIKVNENIKFLNEVALQSANNELQDVMNKIEEFKKSIPASNLYDDLENRREKGLDLAKLNVKEMRKLRTEIQLIFQDPYSSLPPRMTVGSILTEAVKVHKIVPKDKIKDHIRNIMKRCGLQPQYYDRYPHEFSGGQRQRICIARALAVNPKLVICDEPVSALDVSIQAQIINLLKELQNDLGLTYLFISHDLSVVKYITDQIIVMYLGNMMEIGDTDDIFKNPLHPYTQALFSAVPVPDPDAKMQRIILNGDIPSPANPPKGCKFHTRCIKCTSACKLIEPSFVEFENGHRVACHLYNEEIMANMAEYDAIVAANEQKELEAQVQENNKDE